MCEITKGNWLTSNGAIYPEESKDGRTIARLVNGTGADACLIAAAPDLLDALRAAIIDSEQTLTKSERVQRAYLYKMAVAKAEGK